MSSTDNTKPVTDWNKTHSSHKVEAEPSSGSHTVPRTTNNIIINENAATSEDERSLDDNNPNTTTGATNSSVKNVTGIEVPDNEHEYTVEPSQESKKPDFLDSAKGGVFKTISSVRNGLGLETKSASALKEEEEHNEDKENTQRQIPYRPKEEEKQHEEKTVPESDMSNSQSNIYNSSSALDDKEKGNCEKPISHTDADNIAKDQPEKPDLSILKGAKVNKAGNLVNSKGDVVGRITTGDAKGLCGKSADGNGDIWNEFGKVVGKAVALSEDDPDQKTFAPFENFPEAVVESDGRVTAAGKQIGAVVEGDPKRFKGSRVDEDGDILDRNRNVIGKAESWDEPEALPDIVDHTILAGKRVNKAGNVVDTSGTIYGKVTDGNISTMVGRMCDKDGNVRSESGDMIGKAEVVPEGEREGSKEGPFTQFTGLTVRKDGKIITPSNEVVGRLISGDSKALFGRSVDEDGDITDKNGNVIGKSERYEEPEEEKERGPMSGHTVNREGNVVDGQGNVIGRLVSGEVLNCSGKEVDDDNDVVNSKGNTIGHVALLADIPDSPEPEETEDHKNQRKQAEDDKKLAERLSSCIEQSLDRVRPICKMIDDHMSKAEQTPKEELDEESLVSQVRPLLEEGGKILDETNGVIRGLDPDGRIQRHAKHKSSTKDASAEEHQLAEVLKELTGTVGKTVESAKRKVQDMPHAKKELNPLWGLLMEPLGQILAAVGLLLNGVLGLVGRLLSGLGLGNLVDGLLGGLGLNKILASLGLGSAYDALVGKDQGEK